MRETDLLRRALATASAEAILKRHHLHMNPELSLKEAQTAHYVAGELESLDLDLIQTGVGGHGIVATLRGRLAGGKQQTVAMRADMDALPIQEESDLPYRSCSPGVMHACGHDGHTAMLLGAATALAAVRDTFSGTFRFLFQPAEEIVKGAEAMCAEGAMEHVNSVIGLHGWPGFREGVIVSRPGPLMASSDNFELIVQGRGTHAAMPHRGIDPVLTACHIVLALQSLVSRETAPTEPAVLTVARFDAGTADNIIPDKARLIGTVRCLSEGTRSQFPESMERIIGGICEAMRAEYTFEYQFGTGVTVNHPGVTALVEEVARGRWGQDAVLRLEAPSMAAEDFSVYQRFAPGAFFHLGVGERSPNLHTPRYNFPDTVVPIGIELLVLSGLRLLAEGPDIR